MRADRRPAHGQREGHLLLGGRRRARRPRPAVDGGRRCWRRWATRAPRAILLTHIHFDHAGATGALRAALARPARLRARARRAAHGRPGAARGERRAAVRRRGGAAAAVGRGRAGAGGEHARAAAAARRCSATSASSTRPATPPTTSATCTSRAARPSSATSPACASRRASYVIAPDAAARHRRRGVGALARHRRGLGPAGARADPLRPRRRRRAAPRARCASACTRPCGSAAAHGQEAFVAGIRSGSRSNAGDLRRQYSPAAPPDHLYLGLERWHRKRAEAAGAG